MSNAVQTLTVVDSVKKMQPEFALALPKHIPPERFTRFAISAINSNPDLLKPDVDKRSLYASVMQAAQDGLMLDKKEAALVMFGKVVTYMPMVAGILKKMRNSGDIAGVTYGVVYKNEVDQGLFKYVKGDHEVLEHNPILFGEKGDLVGVYAIVTTKDGFKIRAFMDKAQIEKVRNVSRSKSNGPWVSWYEEMAVKSVLRKVAKISPSSSDLDAIFEADEETSGIIHDVTPQQNTAAVEPQPYKKRNSTLDKVKATVSTSGVQPSSGAAVQEAEYEDIPQHIADTMSGDQASEEELPI